MVNEAKLLMQLKNRERGAIDKAIETYTPYLGTVLYRTAGNRLPREDIEEIVSDVFLALWNKAESIDLKKGTIRSYIAAAARNFALKRLSERSKRTDDVCLDGLEIPDEAAYPQKNAAYSAVWDAVMRLGEPDSEIYVRYYLYDEKLKDIAAATALNLSTVKTKLSRGKRKLKNMLLHAEEMV